MIAVSFEPADRVALLALQLDLPFPVLSDPERTVYNAYGLGSGSWLRIFSPGTIWTYVKHFAVGRRYEHRSSDWKQLGGDFILDAAGAATFEHRSTAPNDRPEVSQLIELQVGPNDGEASGAS